MGEAILKVIFCHCPAAAVVTAVLSEKIPPLNLSSTLTIMVVPAGKLLRTRTVMVVFPAENGMFVGNPPSLIFGAKSLPIVVPAQVWEPAGFNIRNTVLEASAGSTTVGVELVVPPNDVVV